MSKPIYMFDGWRLDTGRRTLTNPCGDYVKLTQTEHNIMEIFCSRPQQKIDRYEFATLDAGEQAICVYMTRLRKKLGDKERALVKSVRLKGYYFAAPVSIE